MPAAMIYAAVQGAVDPSAFLAAIGAGAAAAGLRPGPWTSAQVVVPVESTPAYSFPASASPTEAQQTQALRIGGEPLTAAQRAQIAATNGLQPSGNALYGTSGPFNGMMVVSEAPSPAPRSVPVSAFKQVLLGTMSASGRGRVTSAVFNTLHAFNVSTAPWGTTPIGDRGVPANPEYSEAGAASSSGGMLLGIAVVAGLAYYAARGSERRRAVMAGIKARKTRAARRSRR